MSWPLLVVVTFAAAWAGAAAGFLVCAWLTAGKEEDAWWKGYHEARRGRP